MLNNKVMILVTFCMLFTSSAFAAKLINKTDYVVEFSQVIGGYAANNPVSSQQTSKLLANPGSSLIRGHLMVINPNLPGQYVDNIIFYYQKLDGKFKFHKFFDLYHQLHTQINAKGDLIISMKA